MRAGLLVILSSSLPLWLQCHPINRFLLHRLPTPRHFVVDTLPPHIELVVILLAQRVARLPDGGDRLRAIPVADLVNLAVAGDNVH